MWGACVGVYQLLNWKMHGETLKNAPQMFYIAEVVYLRIRGRDRFKNNLSEVKQIRGLEL